MSDITQAESRKHFCQIVDLYLPSLEKVKVIFDELCTLLCVEDIEHWVDVPEDSVLSDLSDEIMYDLYGVGGAPVSQSLKDKLRESCSWCSLRHVASGLSLDDYQALVHARNAYAAKLSTWDGSSIIRVPKAKFALKLYDDFGVSTRNCTDYGLDVSSRLYLGLHHIMKYWSMDTLTKELNIKATDCGKKWKQYGGWTGDGKSQAVSFALAPRIGDYIDVLRKELHDRRRDASLTNCTLAETCFVMVPRNDPHLPESWKSIIHPKAPNVTFFPYHTLKAIGLPAIPKLEDVINNTCGIKQ